MLPSLAPKTSSPVPFASRSRRKTTRPLTRLSFGTSRGNRRHREVELEGLHLIVSRTGWSSELGYEIFLQDESQGDELWEKIMEVGTRFGLKPGHTSSIRRIEGGMLSYHADADINTNPYELGLDRLVNLEMKEDFIGKAALHRIQKTGVRTKYGIIADFSCSYKPGAINFQI